jgi:hypothetical protein
LPWRIRDWRFALGKINQNGREFQLFYWRSSLLPCAAKVLLTGIEPKIIAQHGLVSEPTAAGLAKGIRQKLHADLGLSVTGVAGPEAHDASR